MDLTFEVTRFLARHDRHLQACRDVEHSEDALQAVFNFFSLNDILSLRLT